MTIEDESLILRAVVLIQTHKPFFNIWKQSRVQAFWDRPGLSYEKWWHTLFNQSSPVIAKNTLIQSMLYMDANCFVTLIGPDLFIQEYPNWRTFLLDDKSLRAITHYKMLDLEWSWLVCGILSMKHPTLEWFNLTKKQIETFNCLAKLGYGTIYEVAKTMSRNYRRTYDDVQKLISIGVIGVTDKLINGRKCKLVWV